jgi:hypothetical protein
VERGRKEKERRKESVFEGRNLELSRFGPSNLLPSDISGASEW